MKDLDASPVWRRLAADTEVKAYKGKRAFDVAAALAMCALFAPVAICAGAMVWRQSGRPIVFKHRRVGLGGQSFDVYKFRSMVKNADARLAKLLEADPEAAKEWAESHKLKNDPRVTAIGRFLRKTSLDELPQIINVLKGDMSLVGPRPVVLEELEKYGESLPYYLACKPGLTGPWQVSGRNDISYAQRVKMDEEYSRKQSFTGDLLIALKTAGVFFKATGH